MPESRITLAAVAGAHGIAGEVRLKLFAQSVDSLRPHRQVEIDGKSFVMSAVRAGGQGAIVRLDGVASRDAAEALRGRLLTVDREALPPLAEGEYYHVDLIGLRCVTEAGETLGQVAAVENFGAGDIVEIEKADGKRSMVPLRSPAARLQAGEIVVDPAFLA